MITDLIPTHRTNRSIGKIKAGSHIRVAQFKVNEYFSHTLSQLGVDGLLCKWHYFGQAVKFRDPNDIWHKALRDDYIITDGNHIEVSDTDSGWSPPTARKVSGTEQVNIGFHETYYCLYGEDTDTTIRVDAKTLHELADYILTYIPEPDPLTDAHMVHAEHKKSLFITTFALIEGMWYDTDGGEYSEEHLLEDYNITEVLR